MKTAEGKVVVLGSQGVGKTSLIGRYMGKVFNRHENPTIGACFLNCNLNFEDARIKLQVWDTAGQERFRSMAPMYYRNANAAMLVFDLTEYSTFSAIKSWVTELQRNVEETMVLVVVGNKSDLVQQRQVDDEDAREYATKIGATYYETSVLHNEGIEAVFLAIGIGLLKLQSGNDMETSLRIGEFSSSSCMRINGMPPAPSIEESPQNMSIAYAIHEKPFTCYCYTRVAIGSKLSDTDVFSSVTVASISECEDECSKRRNSCNAFAFGIGIKGNGTCALSTKMPKFEELESHIDYDVYLRSQRSPDCEPDRLYKMGSGGIGQERRNETRPTTRFGSGLLGPTMPSVQSSSRIMGMPNVANNPPYQQGYTSSFDDERRIGDILRNKGPLTGNNPFGTKTEKIDNYNDLYPNRKFAFDHRINYDPNGGRSDFSGPFFQNPFADVNRLNLASQFDSDLHSYKTLTVHNGPFEVFSGRILIHDAAGKYKSPTDFGFWNDPIKNRNTLANHRLNQHRDHRLPDNAYKSHGIITKPKQNELVTGNRDIEKVPAARPSIDGSYGFGSNGAKTSYEGFKATPAVIWRPGSFDAFPGFGAKISEKSKSCYRRLLSGKKSLELHVRRAIECERIEDCHRACDYEKLFACEGFNYRRIGHGTRGMCEMTSIPYSRMDLHRDFVSDPQCDYYEKDPNCVANTAGTRPSWWNQPSRPSQTYGIPSGGRPDVSRKRFGNLTKFTFTQLLKRESKCASLFPYPPAPTSILIRAKIINARPYTPDRRPLNEVPRPLDYDRRPLKEIPRPLDFDRRPANEIPRPLDYPHHRPVEHDRRPPVIYGEPHRVLFDDTFGQRGYPDEGSIRSGYPVLRPEDGFHHSGRFPPSRPSDDDFYDRNLPWPRYPKYPDRRIDHGPTHDIGTNEIGPYLPEHRKDPSRDWDPYGTTYGGSYGYNTNYVGNKFDIPKYYPKQRPKPQRPYENEQFYGEFYNYGGAFGYGDNYIPADQDPLYGDVGKTDECSVRAGAGFRLGRGVVRKTYLTPNLDQCESLCVNEQNYICMSFSYRYNVAPTDPTDNCLLSDVSYKNLNFYTDLEPDRDYDIYAMIANSRTCGTKRGPSQHPPDECFWRVRSGYGMPDDVVRKSIIVDSLGECQVECTVAHDFTCRSFAYKYGLDQGRQDILTNCYLSDWQSQDINPSNMPDMDGAELYERGSFGRGCQPYSVPFFNTGRFNGKQFSQEDEICYSGYDKPCKLTPYAVLLATYVNSEQNCRQKCSRMRESDSIPCMSYSYKITTHGTEENCLLSDVPIRDLRPGLDYVHDDDHVLYAWKDLDPQCVVTGYSIDDDHAFGGPGPLRPSLPGPSYPNYHPAGADYPSMRPDDAHPDPRPFFTMPKPNGHHHGVRPYDPDRPDPIKPYRPGYSGYDDKFAYGIRPGEIGYGHESFYPGEYSTFRYYTVNGYPCKRGTKCEKNKIAGFWSCETEGSEFGSWDYCCTPSQHCGFSQGYHYPWCHVGVSEDQWRPCSENYFPYLPSPRPSVHGPSGGDDDHHHRLDPHGGPGYYGRHWPITYLHREPPPNCTDSFASADNSGNRRTNETTPATAEKPTSIAMSTETSDGNSTTADTRAYRRRLRTRMTPANNDTRRDRPIYLRKTGVQPLTANHAHRPGVRAARIEQVSKPPRAVPLGGHTPHTVTASPRPTAAAAGGAGAQLERVRLDGGMIKVPLIAPNNSLPTGT
ncbi:PREDICTED: LOW QUALITY PROTEIN: uncharacterized protein LOC106748385 [Dinoponera quadriceps]|uniref:LOW QUALITY PROTEIN: uncharacterized protein LOC106748385 n=1 Tax=Dinoponera quadriceps TaxID=609295 RepID=A0A6P3XUZ5_DINQU|nr:PREDICTED: LOW QUALITY PROTEIN: uncharacterized protein LOC106748385 [Dinoponera quadriceps]